MAFNTFAAELIAQKYTNLMVPVIQQGDTRTAPSTEYKTGLQGRDIQILDYIAAVTPRTVTDLTTVRSTVVDSATTESRWLPAPSLLEHTIRKAATFDLNTLVQQDSAVRDAQTKGFKREMDKMFYTAALGNAITNINLIAEVANTSPAGIQAPYTFVALPAGNTITPLAGTAITAAIDDALKLFDSMDVDTSEHKIYCYINSAAKGLLFEDTRYDNWNNMGNQVLADGNLVPYRGVEFVRLSDSGVFNGSTKILLVAGKAICMGIWSDLKTEISVLPEHSYAQQIYTSMSAAATRLDEKRVVAIDIQNID